MLHEAPEVLIALEQSGLAAAIRQSVWAYPAANVGHIVALTLFAGSVAIMDARLLGVTGEADDGRSGQSRLCLHRADHLQGKQPVG